jgi:hypothetical protein
MFQLLRQMDDVLEAILNVHGETFMALHGV